LYEAQLITHFISIRLLCLAVTKNTELDIQTMKAKSCKNKHN